MYVFPHLWCKTPSRFFLTNSSQNGHANEALCPTRLHKGNYMYIEKETNKD